MSERLPVPGEEVGLLGRLQRLFRRAPEAAVPAAAPKPAPPRAPPPPVPGATLSAALEAMHVVLAKPEAPTDAEAAQVEEIAAIVRWHVCAQKPELTAFPSLSLRILNLVAAPDVDLNELSRAVSQDTAVAADVLRVANSAASAAAQPIETVRDAIVRLGCQEVARVAGAVAARSLFTPDGKARAKGWTPIWNDLFLRAIVVGLGASWLSMEHRVGRSDRALLVGMLHDVGRSIALRSIAAQQAEGTVPNDLPIAQLQRIVDAVHAEVGASVLREWKLPAYLVDAAEQHHRPIVGNEESHAELHLVRVVGRVWDLQAPVPAVTEAAASELAEGLGALKLRLPEVRTLDQELVLLETKLASALSLKRRDVAPARVPKSHRG